MEELLKTRPDLAGLPIVLGEACRLNVERGQQFQNALNTIRNSLNQQLTIPISEAQHAAARAAARFWHQYQGLCFSEDHVGNSPPDAERQKSSQPARIAALMQVLGPDSANMRQGLARFLAGVSDVEATRALARLAIFAAEPEVCQAALEALKVRRERDYQEILLAGLRYPWPAVAKRAAEAIVKLERKDLAPQLVALLDEADPRAPVQVDGQEAPVVRELVKINHHQNCLLCHAPGSSTPHQPGGTGNPRSPQPGHILAAVPIPGEPFGSFSTGYQNSSPDIVVRADITYLRQDFSMLMPVADAHPWPQMQRFDFLVRTRTLTAEEAKTFRAKLNSKDAPSPYHQLAHAALRQLTGQDAAPTAQAWRSRLNLPAPAAAPTMRDAGFPLRLPLFP
jgi:hypothetical protein